MDVKTDVDEEEYDADLDSEEAVEKAGRLEKDAAGGSDDGGERNEDKGGKDGLCSDEDMEEGMEYDLFSDEDMEYDFCSSDGEGAGF